MRISKFLSLVACITFFALIYVWQQAEVLRLAYAGEKKLVVFQDLLDKNSILRYNIGRTASLTTIGKRVFRTTSDFYMPDSYRLVKLAGSASAAAVANQPVTQRESLAARIFGIKRQAEAKPVNP